LSLTDDIGNSPVARNSIWKSPVELNGVHDFEDICSIGFRFSSKECRRDTAVGFKVRPETSTTGNKTVRSGVNTNTFCDLVSAIGVNTERHNSSGLGSKFTLRLGDLTESLGTTRTKDLETGGVLEHSFDTGSLREDVIGKSDFGCELDLEGRVISGGQVLGNWNGQDGGSGHGVIDGTFWSLVCEGGSWLSVGEVGIIDSPLGVGNRGCIPNPVLVGHWVLDPFGGGSNISSVSSRVGIHREHKVPWLFDDGRGIPIGHGDSELIHRLLTSVL
jgi:hypothetical protein